MPLILDAQGRFIQGPDTGKVRHLLDAGAVRKFECPRRFPIRRGRQLVCVFVDGLADHALWIQDREDFVKARDSKARLRVWLELASEDLVTAERLPAVCLVDDTSPPIFSDLW